MITEDQTAVIDFLASPSTHGGQAAVWGILAGVFNSIPYFGPIIVSGGLLLVGLVQSGDPTHAIKISAAALVITALEGWVLTPPLMGKAERMHVPCPPPPLLSPGRCRRACPRRATPAR